MRSPTSVMWHNRAMRGSTLLMLVACLAATVTAVPVAARKGLDVLRVTPAQNALSVARNTSIDISFSNNVDPRTLSADSIRVNGAQSGLHSGSVAYDRRTKTARFVPDSIFRAGEMVDVTLTQGVRSTSGSPLLSPLNWSFSVISRGSSGGFSPGSTLAVGDDPLGVVAIDGNGDEYLDLIVSNHSGTVSIMRNNGDGTFLSYQTLNAEPWTYPPSVGDLDADGDLDFVVPGRAYGHVLIFTNGGDGSFALRGVLSAGPEPQFVVVRDFDGDGDLDLSVLCNSASIRQVITFLNNGHAGFSQEAVMTLHTARTHDFASGDFDGDGDWDLYIPSFPQLVLLNNGNGSFAESPRPDMGTDFGTPVVSDLDGDGDVDLAIPSTTSYRITTFANDGNGLFTASVVNTVLFSSRNIAMGDFDSDGDMDLAAPNSVADVVYILENDGSGNFVPVSAMSVDSPYYIAAADLNDDQILDLVVANGQSDAVSILLGEPGFSILLPLLSVGADL